MSAEYEDIIVNGEVVGRRLVSQAAPVPEERRITGLAFWNRFHLDERTAIDLRSIDDPVAEPAERQFRAALRDMKTQVLLASRNYIDLARADVRAQVEQVCAGMGFAATRATEILDDPIADIERPE